MTSIKRNRSVLEKEVGRSWREKMTVQNIHEHRHRLHSPRHSKGLKISIGRTMRPKHGEFLFLVSVSVKHFCQWWWCSFIFIQVTDIHFPKSNRSFIVTIVKFCEFLTLSHVFFFGKPIISKTILKSDCVIERNVFVCFQIEEIKQK